MMQNLRIKMRSETAFTLFAVVKINSNDTYF